jgi:hypothetical protein
MKCYKLKVKLLNISKSPIWRDILVHDDITFEELHHIIQMTMGWGSCHMHQFIVGNRRNGVYIGISEDELGSFDTDMDQLDHSEVLISQYLKKVKDKCWYEYDFGDGWEHEVNLLEIVDVSKDQPIPFVLKGKGACPPEDCGGPWGYEELKETIKNPKAAGYEEMIEWVGDDFDPNHFDLEAANDRLLEQFLMPNVQEMIEQRVPNDVLLNFSNKHTSTWSNAQLNLAKKEFGELVNLELPIIEPTMSKEEVQMIATGYIEQVFMINPKAVHIVGEGSFIVVMVQLLISFGVPCVESTFERSVGISKTSEKEVKYTFSQFREYF